MKINLLILAFIIASAAGWTNFSNNHERPSAANFNLEAAPTFSYTTIDGKQGHLNNHKGKVVMVHFWASWCAPCIVEFPDLMALAEEKPNIIVLAVSINERKSDIQGFLSKINVALPDNVIIIQDATKTISEGLYGTVKLPETFILSPGLSVVEKVIGAEEKWDSRPWHRKIDLLSVHKAVDKE